MATIAPSASYRFTVRLQITNHPGMLGRVAMAIGQAGGTSGPSTWSSRAATASSARAWTS